MRRVMNRLIAFVTGALLLTGTAPAAVAFLHPQVITLTLREYAFTPRAITLRAGVPVKLVLVNAGRLDHEFQVYPVPTDPPRDWNAFAMSHTYFRHMGEIDVALPGADEVGTTSLFKVHVAPGARVIIWFTPRAKGTFEMASHDPGQYGKGMRGIVVVQ